MQSTNHLTSSGNHFFERYIHFPIYRVITCAFEDGLMGLYLIHKMILQVENSSHSPAEDAVSRCNLESL